MRAGKAAVVIGAVSAVTLKLWQWFQQIPGTEYLTASRLWTKIKYLRFPFFLMEDRHLEELAPQLGNVMISYYIFMFLNIDIVFLNVHISYGIYLILFSSTFCYSIILEHLVLKKPYSDMWISTSSFHSMTFPTVVWKLTWSVPAFLHWVALWCHPGSDLTPRLYKNDGWFEICMTSWFKKKSPTKLGSCVPAFLAAQKHLHNLYNLHT